MRRKSLATMILVVCMFGAVAAEAQQSRAECEAACAQRWLNDCPAVVAEIIDYWIAHPDAAIESGVAVGLLEEQLLGFCDEGYNSCIANCPPE